jgi:hypothetical protein
VNGFWGQVISILRKAVVEIRSDLWQTTPMKSSLTYPTHLEDRKVLKLMERIKTQVLRANDIRQTVQQAAVPKSPQSAA